MFEAVMFEAGDAQLTARFALKSRSALTIEEVADEDCSEPSNPESIHQLIFVDLKGGKSVTRLMPTKNAQNPPPPELFNSLDIRIIGSPSFAQIIWEGAQAYQLHVSPSLLEEHLWADTDVPIPKTKLEDQILHKVVPPKYHKYADMFSKGSTKELPPHYLYDYKIDLEEGTLPPFG
ncbi:hypothetical protein C0995_003554 [Termitomyces sp. Mi166|nr:hypothetical protein C0995_003554 [Termitomyces sp. Mi166\